MLFAAGVVLTSVYPSLISINQEPTLLLKKARSHRSPSWIDWIVTSQYTAAVVLLICIMCVYFQLSYILSKPLGIEKDGIIVIDCPLQQRVDFQSKLNYFTNTANTIRGIHGITVSKNVPGDFAGYGIPLQRRKNGEEFGFDTNGGVDEGFL